MFLVGLTGGIATGKSVVSSIIQDLGVPVIDADLIARQIVEPGEPAYEKIKKIFGSEVLQEKGEIDRKKLGNLVFKESDKRRTLNSITHPYIYSKIRKKVFNYFLKGEQFIVLDLPLLYESEKVLGYLYKTIVVSCNDDLQLERLMVRNGYSKIEAKDRIIAQMPLSEKVEKANFVIENSGSLLSTRNQVEGIISMLKTSKRHIRNKFLYGSLLILVFIVALLGIFSLVNFIL